jgi:hypothetical protein
MMAAYGEEEEGGQIDEAEWQDEDPEGNAEMQREIALKLGKKSKRSDREANQSFTSDVSDDQDDQDVLDTAVLAWRGKDCCCCYKSADTYQDIL